MSLGQLNVMSELHISLQFGRRRMLIPFSLELRDITQEAEHELLTHVTEVFF